jgi:predicted dehydrogenase
MTHEVKVALAGIAGYGDSYLEALLHNPRTAASGARLVGVADPAPQRCRKLDELRDRDIPVHASLDDLFDAAGPAGIDLMLICTPIHLHARQTCLALRRGASVLCEKPLAGTVEDALRMADCERAAGDGKFVAIGYQWSFSHAVQALKRDIMAGVLGRPVRLKTMVFFPRPVTYFRRNNWVGRIRTEGGDAVLDSPTNNATSHYLHNMLYLLGRTRETSAMPLTLQAELYRANEIENYDTTALRAEMPGGVEVLFYTTHAVAGRVGPVCHFEFEHATVEYDFSGVDAFVARFRDGRATKSYGRPDLDRNEKIWQSIAAVRGGEPIACGVEAALPHTLCVAAAQQSAASISVFAEPLRRMILVNGEPLVAIDGLAEALVDCYERGILPAERDGLTWARAGVRRELSIDRLRRDWPRTLAGTNAT